MLATITGTGTGAAPVVNLTFPFIDKAHVKATVDGVPVTVNWTGANQVTFAAVVAAGATWKVYRATPTSPAVVDYTNGATLTEADLDLSSTSHRYRDEELADIGSQNASDIAALQTADVGLQADIDATAADLAAETSARAALDSGLAERIRDTVGSALRGGTGINVVVSDSSDTITIDNNALPFIVDGISTGDYPLQVFAPEQFGAVGDGVADDGPALAAMGAAVSSAGRGVIMMRGVTYRVGGQTLNKVGPAEVGGNTYTFGPNQPYIIPITGTTGPVILFGNGARIKTLDGAKYGAFNEDGTARADALPFFGAAGVVGSNIATPYFGMIDVSNTSGGVYISGIELDGNIKNLTIGGPWGDSGRQLVMTGIRLRDNTGPIFVAPDVNSHHHGEDGIAVNGPGLLNVREFVTIHGRYANNGRLALALTGGNGVHLGDGAQFIGTGKDLGPTMTYSGPGAGIDMEAESGRYVVNTTAGKIYVAGNTSQGLVSVTNPNVDGFVCHGGTFIGEYGQAIIFQNPNFKLYDGLVVGQIENPHGNQDPRKAFQMIGGKWTDDLALSPSGLVCGNNNPYGAMMPVGGTLENVRFENVLIEGTTANGDISIGGQGIPMDSLYAPRLHNCTIKRVTPHLFNVYGVYSGERTELINATIAPDPNLPGLYEAGVALDSFMVEAPIAGITRQRRPANADRATGLRVIRSTAAPTTGTWAKGDRVENTNPTAGGYAGWICTVAGTPGTWKGYGAIAP